VHDAIHCGNPEAARAAAESHLHFTRTALAEIDKADRQVEQSLSRFATADSRS
jgi:GntR family transcriptional repressor for pyruvate dehydrogenase complex